MVLSFALIVSITPLAQADDSKAEVKLKVKVVSPIRVTTISAWPVGYSMALLHGRLDDMGTSSSVNVYFEWGEKTDYGSMTMTKVRRMTHTGSFSAAIHGLTPGTPYHFRAVAEDGNTSDVEEFTTRRHWWWPW